MILIVPGGNRYYSDLWSLGPLAGTMSLMVRVRPLTTGVTQTIVDDVAGPLTGCGSSGEVGNYSHATSIPADGAVGHTGAVRSWSWFGLINGKPTFRTHDGRPLHDNLGAGINLGDASVQSPDALPAGVCAFIVVRCQQASAVATGTLEMIVDGVVKDSVVLPMWPNGNGYFQWVYDGKNSCSFGNCMDSSYLTESGNLGIEQFLIPHLYLNDGTLAPYQAALCSNPGWTYEFAAAPAVIGTQSILSNVTNGLVKQGTVIVQTSCCTDSTVDSVDIPTPVNNATKCCNGMEGTTPSGSGISGGVEPNPYTPTDPPIYDCDGNGTIEDIDDPTRPETFA